MWIEVCSGPPRVCGALGREGFDVMAGNIDGGLLVDLSDGRVAARLRGWIRSGLVAGVHAAVHGRTLMPGARPRNGAGPLRSAARPEDISGLSGRDEHCVARVNALVSAIVSVLRLCAVRNIPWSLEASARSFLWALRSVANFRKLVRCAMVEFHMCEWVAPWRRPTYFLSSRSMPLARVQRRCEGGHSGLCPNRGHRHRPLPSRWVDRRSVCGHARRAVPQTLVRSVRARCI